LLAFLYATFLILRTLLFGVDVPGYASLMVTVLFLGGVQLITLGIIGEYIGRVYEEVKRRPLYLVRNCYGFDPQREPDEPTSAATLKNTVNPSDQR
jgi:glycosyltransferase involved in cell wall biosynthesis